MFVLTDFKDSPPSQFSRESRENRLDRGGGTDRRGGNKRPKKRFSIRLVFNFSAFYADRKKAVYV